MKVLFLAGDAPHHRALANKIHAIHPLTAIALVKPRRNAKKAKFLTRLTSITIGYPLRRAWVNMLSIYAAKYPSYPAVQVTSHENVNAASVSNVVQSIKPDLVVVSGTNLLKKGVIDEALKTGKVINLHTGISPYVRGGPNCTNVCLAFREFDRMGNTIMWIDAGIDSGNLIATERTPLTGHETLNELHLAVMEHGHDLYVRAISALRDCKFVPNVPQVELPKGRLILSKHWSSRMIARAVVNYFINYRPDSVAVPSTIRLVSLHNASPPGQ